jgi:acyl-CoA synthetase (AMP-forming)/AMP-acid ligase II
MPHEYGFGNQSLEKTVREMNIDVSGWATRLSDDVISLYKKNNKWLDKTLFDSAKQCADRHPDRIAVVDGEIHLSFSQVLENAYRLASTLRSKGLSAGSVVSFQLPNWHEAVVINLACSIGGFVCNPIVPIYRDAEVGYILKNSRTSVLFVPERFRSTDYLEMIERLRPGLPDLKDVVLVRSGKVGYSSYSEWIGETDSVDAFPPVDPNAVKLLLYTSGTTGNPKGVLHSHNTLRAELEAVAAFWSLTDADVVLMPSPVTHITGYLYGLELPFTCGIKSVLMDRWNPADALSAIEVHGATFSIGATPFLVELTAEIERQGKKLPTLRLYGSGGAPVPPDVVIRANKVLPNCRTFRVYGSSEAPTVSLGVCSGDPAELGATTDGFIFNHDVRIVDAVTGEVLGIGADGEIVTRGPEVMLGYTDPRHTEEAFDADGFFHTGDLGRIDDKGYITVTGRKKDLIIRGGENLSPKEIEDVLHQHPSIFEAAVVAMPHDRMGETPCAFVVLKPGVSLEFNSMIEFLEKAKLARQKFPEHMFVVNELPHTASGKVLKHVLRDRAAKEAVALSAQRSTSK